MFIERRCMNRPDIVHKIKNIIIRYDNTILLEFLMPTKDPGINLNKISILITFT